MLSKTRGLAILAGVIINVWHVSATAVPVPTQVPKVVSFPVTHLPLPLGVKSLSLHVVEYDRDRAEDSDLGLPAGWKIVGNPVAALRAEGLMRRAVPGSHVNLGPPTVSTNNPGATPLAASTPPMMTEGETGLWLPLGELTSVAAFRAGAQAIVVADGHHPLDTSLVPAAGPIRVTSVRLMDSITIITLAVPDQNGLSIVPSGDGWSVMTSANASDIGDMRATERDDVISFAPPAGEAAARVVALVDPLSGRRLLLGLARKGRITTGTLFRGAGFAVRSSLVGLVVAADSDAIELRIAGKEFILDAIGEGSADRLFRHFGQLPVDQGSGVVLSGLPLDELRERYRQAWTEAALAPPGKRFEARIGAAKMAALSGDRADLEGALMVALRDRPEGASRADVMRLEQVASTLRHRVVWNQMPDTMGNTTEDQFWRGELRLLENAQAQKSQEDRQKTARLLVAGLSVAEGYSGPLRRQILPQAATFIARYAPTETLSALAACDTVTEERLACALRAARLGQKDADTRLDNLARDTDPDIAEGAKEERLARAYRSGKIKASALADALDVLIPAARLAGREREVRLAEMRAALAAGQTARVQTLLDEWAQVFPSRQQDVQPIMEDFARRAEASPDAGAIPDRLTFLRKNLETAGAEGRVGLLSAISAQYEALGLLRQARESLQAAVKGLKVDQQPQLRLRLARLDLRSGDFSAALHDIQPVFAFSSPGSTAPNASGDGMRNQAVLVRARALFGKGQYDAAKEALKGRSDKPAQLLLVDMAEKNHDWAGAARLLQGLSEAVQKGKSFDDEQRQYVMRATEDASRAGDPQFMRELRERYGPEMSQGAQGRIFNLLTGAAALSSGAVAGG